jgi:(E)-4-hydroxy-3-methylbut-2-enyl-diphosphate synthase
VERIERKKTFAVQVGNIKIGSEAPIVIQSMTNTKTTNINATLEQIYQLEAAGCELIRLAVPDMPAAKALEKVVVKSPLPVIADIHFDLKLAFQSLESGAAKVRVNPGNLGGYDKLIRLASRAKQLKVPIRIGVNAGSLEKNIISKFGGPTAEALVESALNHVQALQSIDFHDLVISLKASDVYTTICAYRRFSKLSAYPLHLGVTGAGPLYAGIIKGSIGIGTLLADGIGDTIRVSLTADPVEEVKAARRIIQSLGLRKFMPELISCPTCGRCEIDLVTLTEKVEDMLKDYSIPITVAVMGCIVNGPGEAKEADIGISAGKKRGILFSYGKVIKTASFSDLLGELKREIEILASTAAKQTEGI